MHPFALSRPTDISAAIAAHAQDAHLAFIAGGTDLIGLMKDRVILTERLLDINRLQDLAQIEALPDGGVGSLGPQRFGAGTWGKTIDSVYRFRPSVRQPARAGQRARTRRSHRGDRSAPAHRGTCLPLPEASRPPVV